MRLVKRKLQKILLLLLIAAMLLPLAACAKTTAPEDGEQEDETVKYEIVPADLGRSVDIHTEEQAAYLKDDYQNIAAYTPEIANTERSHPREIALSWTVGGENVPAGTTYRVSVGLSSDLENAATYTTKETSVQLSNLYVGTTYYWKVCFEEGGTTYESPIASFATKGQGPRNIKIDGVTNCRDLGGWKTTDGKKVKQGLIYRTGRVVDITEAGKATMVNELGIKTEIDLYGGGKVINGINYLKYAVSDSGTLTDLEQKLPQIFNVLADESNYPIFFHCYIGTDRTGGLAFLIGGLLGVSKTNLYYDYCFSNFGKLSGDTATSFTVRDPSYLNNKVVATLEAISTGSTLQQKVRNYLKSIGISDATMDAVVRILTA